jgi:flagellar hook-length control protein FliK
MSTVTKATTNSQTASIDYLPKASKMDFSNKVTSDAYKTDSKKVVSKSENAKSEDFKDVLTSKVNYKDDEQKVDTNNETKDMTKIDEVKEDLKVLDEDSKTASKDDVNEILNQLLNLLAKLGINSEELKQDGQVNVDALKKIIEVVNEKMSSDNSLSAVMEKLMELMKNNSVKEALDPDSLKSMQNILSNLNAKIADDNTETAKDMKSTIKNLMSEVSKVIENKQNTKVLTLEDILKNYSQESKDGSLGNESNKNGASETANNKEVSKEVSKEDKFLNSLLDDKKDSSLDKINLFASRTQVVQNQSGDTIRGLTINKATFANDLIKDVKFMSTNAMKELTVKINPGDLGEITIKLIQEDGVMKANLKANSKEATMLLSQNLADIKKQLTEQNIKIADVNIELYQDDTTFFSEQGFGGQLSEEQRGNTNSNRSSSANYETITDEDLTDNIASNNNIEFFA